jgi:hypothetical protein
MPKKLLGVHQITPTFPRFELLAPVLLLNIKVVGGFIRDSIRKHTPKRTWFMYSKCKIISLRMMKFTGRVRVGWKKSDFPRGKFYAVWVGEGTGIHGSLRRRITGKFKGGKKGVLRYQHPGGWASMKSIKGIQPRRMLEKGYKSSIPDIMTLMSRTAFNFFRVEKRT